MALDLKGFCDDIKEYDTFRYMGKIEKIVGMTIEASGPALSLIHISEPTRRIPPSRMPSSA